MKIPGRILLLLAAISLFLSACSSAKKVLHPNYRVLAYAQTEDRSGVNEVSSTPAITPSKFSVQEVSHPLAKQIQAISSRVSTRHTAILSTGKGRIATTRILQTMVSNVQPKPVKTPEEKNHSLAIMGFVFSLVGFVGIVLPFALSIGSPLVLILVPCGIVGLVLSATALTRLKKGGNANDKDFALAGLVIGIVDCSILLLALLLLALIIVVLSGFGE